MENNNLLVSILRIPSKVDDLLNKLDKIAQGYEPYEYGLPIYNDGVKAQMREAVYQWLLENKEVCK